MELCNPTSGLISSSKSVLTDSSGSEHESCSLNGEPRVIWRRTRFNVDQKFEIAKELKYSKKSMKEIAIAHKTTTSNVKRWKALYSSYKKRIDRMNNARFICEEYFPRDIYI
jgi:UDP-N-acetylglucosamine 2-epimerase